MAVSLRRGSLKQRGWFFPGHRLDWIRITDSTPKMQTILTTHPQHRKAMCPMMSEVTLAPRFTVYSHYDWLGMVFQKARMPAVSFTVTRGGPNSLKCPSTLLWARALACRSCHGRAIMWFMMRLQHTHVRLTQTQGPSLVLINWFDSDQQVGLPVFTIATWGPSGRSASHREEGFRGCSWALEELLTPTLL